MKFFRQLICQTIAVGFVSMIVVVESGFKGDPTIDLGFAFNHNTAVAETFELMPEDRVATILIDRMLRFPKSESRKLAHHMMKLCRSYRFDPAFILSMIDVESRFQKDAVSPVGAMGLMQLMPTTAALVSKQSGIRYTGPRSLFDPFTNVSLGIAYLAQLRHKYQDASPYFHVAAYNIGPARMDQLLARKHFKPTATKQYYERIRDGVPGLRYYRAPRHAGGFKGGAV